MHSISCYLLGSKSLLVHCGEILAGRQQQLLGVVSDDDQIRTWAADCGVRVIEPATDLAAEICNRPFDYLITIGEKDLPESIRALPRLGVINFHDGPLPRYPGWHATTRALIHGETEHGVTWHLLSPDGHEAILKQRTFPVAEEETSFTLDTKCYEAGIETFGELIDEIRQGTEKPTPYTAEVAGAKAEHEYPEAAAALRWEDPARKLAAIVRALDFGPATNPVGLAKVTTPRGTFAVTRARIVDDAGTSPPGTIVALDEKSITVSTGEGALQLRSLSALDGTPLAPRDARMEYDLQSGQRLLDAPRDLFTKLGRQTSPHESFWARRLATVDPIEPPYANHDGENSSRSYSKRSVALGFPSGGDADYRVAAVCAYLARIADKPVFDIGFSEPRLRQAVTGAESCFASRLWLRVRIDFSTSFADAAESVASEIAELRGRATYARDLLARLPELARRRALSVPRVVVDEVADLDSYQPPEGAELVVAMGPECVWYYDPAVYPDSSIEAMQTQFRTFTDSIVADEHQPLTDVPLLDEAEQHRLLLEWNATEREWPYDQCIHHAFEAQVERTPDAIAVVCGESQLTYGELNGAANRLARDLQALGVLPDMLVGVYLERTPEMVVAILGILKAGAAYVPMDPTYPRAGVALMLDDSRADVVVTSASLIEDLPAHPGETICIDAARGSSAAEDTENPNSEVTPKNLAYTIYTSGSTGKPKGVMVEHRNVMNFFFAMDERIGDSSGTWLAVTSLSFDISVLELLWTLTRGFKVVVHPDRIENPAQPPAKPRREGEELSFSLMYFASDEGESAAGADKYRLLLEGAKFGDRNGFSAVWTPERHFHAFGGLYPNPSVAGAAIATITERIGIRAGSCVLPLHSPIRVAEEWSLVDNLSNGRVGIAFASGWQPNDFVIKPENFTDRKEIMIRDIETVRRLWRGESITLPSPLGEPIDVRTLPRPVQPELPFWVTAAANPETFRLAGELGANVLTHLLGQTTEEVGEKIALYRRAWREAGHTGRGEVSLMLHTFVGPDADEVRETVREPMKNYLRSAVNLVKLASWTFPTFKQQADATGRTPAQVFEEEELSDEDMEALLEHAFSRYYDSSGLFGTPESCLETIRALEAIDVDDVACLLDYGVPSQTVLDHLPYLQELKRLAGERGSIHGANGDATIADQIRENGVTHLQCTPSQMRMILLDDDDRAALGSLRKILVGGEALPPEMAQELSSSSSGDVINMYGPTETTIWSSTQVVTNNDAPVSIGRPVANTEMYILDRRFQPVPAGVPGELYIGGQGVARGYYRRPELTAERFISHSLCSTPGGRLYRTGDRARFNPDGTIEFLGRVDFQVKIRGHRIEPGEIEAVVRQRADVREAVVVVREDLAEDSRLVAYVIARNGASPTVTSLRDRLAEQLPAHLVPAQFVILEAFPLTPNGKIDRQALPAPDAGSVARRAEYVEPEGVLERTVAQVWAELLDVDEVGLDDNFFDLGGHSLLAVQAHRRLKQETGRTLALTDLFRFPTIRALVGYLSQGDGNDPAAADDRRQDRSDARKAAMARRQRLRERRRVPTTEQ